jgi:PAS domain S-box-containing protein
MIVASSLPGQDARRLISAEEWPQSVVISNPELPDNPLVFVSEAFTEQTGFPADETLGRNCRFLQGPGTDPQAIYTIRIGLQRRIGFEVDLLNYRRDGSPFWNRLRIRPQYDLKHRLVFFIGCQNPIDESDVRPLPVLQA